MTLRKNVASQKLVFTLVNATTGAALTGASVTAKISLDGGSSTTATGAVAELANGQYAWSPDAADTNATTVSVQFTATNAVPRAFAIYTTAANPSDAVRLGLTALPNAAAEASGGLATLSAAQSSDGTIPVNLKSILGTLLTETSGLLAAGFKKFFNVSSPTGTANSLPDAVAGASGGVAIVGSAMTLHGDYDAAKTAATQTSVNDVPTNSELTTALAAADDAVLAAIALLVAAPTADQNAAALMDLANGIETGVTPRQALRLLLAADAGKLSGAATTTITIRNAVADSKNRITATVDSDGNRSAITYDLT